MMLIDPAAKISQFFTFREALWLPSWGRLADDNDGLTDDAIGRLKNLFFKMDIVRGYFGQPIVVHCAYRPLEYNALVKGARNSPHLFGDAVDFHIENVSCDDAKQNILDNRMLSTWGMRMERGTTDWIHLDQRPVPEGGNRYFNP